MGESPLRRHRRDNVPYGCGGCVRGIEVHVVPRALHHLDGAMRGKRETLAREWFDTLAAPSKDYVVFDRSGHTPPYDEPGRFADLMSDVVAAVGAGSP